LRTRRATPQTLQSSVPCFVSRASHLCGCSLFVALRCARRSQSSPRSAVIGFSHVEAAFGIVHVCFMLDFVLQLTSTSKMSFRSSLGCQGPHGSLLLNMVLHWLPRSQTVRTGSWIPSVLSSVDVVFRFSRHRSLSSPPALHRRLRATCPVSSVYDDHIQLDYSQVQVL